MGDPGPGYQGVLPQTSSAADRVLCLLKSHPLSLAIWLNPMAWDFFFKQYLCIYLAVLGLSCGRRDL